jgi:uncharacterized membrane protein YkvA (DUF1232 family)
MGSMADSRAMPRNMQYYQKLRRTVRIWAGGEQSRANQFADFILASPDLFVLLLRLSQDSRVSQRDKARLAGAVAYFVNPLDLVPELILGPPGLVDDIAMAAYVLHTVLETTDPSVVREHWEGGADILELIRQILAAADTMVGGPAWRRLVARASAFAATPTSKPERGG